MRLFCKREPSVLFYNASGFITSAYKLTLWFAINTESSSPLNVNSLGDKKVTIPEATFIPRSTTSTGSSKVISHPMQDIQDQ